MKKKPRQVEALVLLVAACLLPGCGSGVIGSDGMLVYAAFGSYSAEHFGEGETIAVDSVFGLKMLGESSRGLAGPPVVTMVGIDNVRSNDHGVVEPLKFGNLMGEGLDANILMRANGVGDAKVTVNTVGHGWHTATASVREASEVEWYFIGDYDSGCFKTEHQVMFAGQQMVRGMRMRNRAGDLMIFEGHPDLFPQTALRTESVILRTENEKLHSVHLKVVEEPGIYPLSSLASGIDGEIEVLPLSAIDEIQVEGAVTRDVVLRSWATGYRTPIVSSNGRQSCLARVFEPDDYQLEVYTPEVCKVIINADEFTEKKTRRDNGWYVTHRLRDWEEGTCHYKISIPAVRGGEGWSFEEKFSMEPRD